MQNTFTLKWEMPEGGTSYFPALAVSLRPLTGVPPEEGRKYPQCLEFDNGDGSGVRASMDRGCVYILNHTGKTIDAIHLGMTPPESS